MRQDDNLDTVSAPELIFFNSFFLSCSMLDFVFKFSVLMTCGLTALDVVASLVLKGPEFMNSAHQIFRLSRSYVRLDVMFDTKVNMFSSTSIKWSRKRRKALKCLRKRSTVLLESLDEVPNKTKQIKQNWTRRCWCTEKLRDETTIAMMSVTLNRSRPYILGISAPGNFPLKSVQSDQ